MKVVFMGTPDFAVPVLKKLIEKHEVVCVYTRAPKPSGRGCKLNKTPVHQIAELNGIEVRTPLSLRSESEHEAFRALKADVAVVAAYGLILPKAVLEAYRYGCLNVHASLLPRWRGAAPIQRSLEAGDEKSGVTIMQVEETLDTGAMFKKGEVSLTADMTGGMLHDQLAVIGANLMTEVLEQIDTLVPCLQDEKAATYAAKLTKEECRLDFSREAVFLERKIRAFNPFPAVFFEYEGERFKVLSAKIAAKTGRPGEILHGKDCLIIACGDGFALDIVEIQRQGKKAMPVAELLKGFSFREGTIVN